MRITKKPKPTGDSPEMPGSSLSRWERKKQRERARMQARREHRATYDLPVVVRQRIKEWAEEEGVPASQLVTLALVRLLQEHDNGLFELHPYKHISMSPKYDWNLVVPEGMLRSLASKNVQNKKSV
ncbi:MAG: hypothetical protein GYA17_12075 [Chloroflexi bacterium]|nr:hypothetical protein [Chloroflexota bacterium]